MAHGNDHNEQNDRDGREYRVRTLRRRQPRTGRLGLLGRIASRTLAARRGGPGGGAEHVAGLDGDGLRHGLCIVCVDTVTVLVRPVPAWELYGVCEGLQRPCNSDQQARAPEFVGESYASRGSSYLPNYKHNHNSPAHAVALAASIDDDDERLVTRGETEKHTKDTDTQKHTHTINHAGETPVGAHSRRKNTNTKGASRKRRETEKRKQRRAVMLTLRGETRESTRMMPPSEQSRNERTGKNTGSGNNETRKNTQTRLPLTSCEVEKTGVVHGRRRHEPCGAYAVQPRKGIGGGRPM